MHHDRARRTGTLELLGSAQDPRGRRAVFHGEAEPRKKLRRGLREEIDIPHSLTYRPIHGASRQPFSESLPTLAGSDHQGAQKRHIAINLETDAADDPAVLDGHERVADVIPKTIQGQARFFEQPLGVRQVLLAGIADLDRSVRHIDIYRTIVPTCQALTDGRKAAC